MEAVLCAASVRGWGYRSAGLLSWSKCSGPGSDPKSSTELRRWEGAAGGVRRASPIECHWSRNLRIEEANDVDIGVGAGLPSTMWQHAYLVCWGHSRMARAEDSTMGLCGAPRPRQNSGFFSVRVGKPLESFDRRRDVIWLLFQKELPRLCGEQTAGMGAWLGRRCWIGAGLALSGTRLVEVESSGQILGVF